MMVDVYFGEISDERKKKWDLEKGSPFDVLAKDNHWKIWKAHTEILWYGREHFHEQIQVDWGSFAWKCTGEEFLEYLKHYRLDIPEEMDENEIDLEKEYGIVFIEMS